MAYTLQILHASDLEGGVDAIQNAPNFAAIVDFLEDEFANSITLSAGDNYIPGPFFNAAGDRPTFRDSGLFNDFYNELFGVDTYDGLREGNGRVDISIMNAIGFDASAIGNHEFDAGSDAFESIIEEDFRDPAGPASDRWVGSQFPYLSANLDFANDGDLGNLFTGEILPSTDFATGPDESTAGNSSVPKIAPATTIEEGGELIGVVGATTQLIEQISSPGGTTENSGGANDMAALAEVLQPVIDQLVDSGINKIVLVSHLQQIALEKELAGLLSGIDVIIAGGSDTLQADATDVLRPGDVADEGYPFTTTNADGDPTVIVSTAGEYSYVGRLVVEFDDNGVVIPGSIDEAVSGAFATLDEVVEALYGTDDPFTEGSKGEQVQTLVDAVNGVVIAQDGNIFGNTEVFIDGRRESVRTQETNLGNLTADANLAIAREFDPTVQVSLKNGGGIRSLIGEIAPDGTLLPTQDNPLSGKEEGEVSQLDIDNALRFNNGLTLLTVTAEELKLLLEHAVAGTAPGSTPGQFPQVGGLLFSFDPNGQAIEFDGEANVVTEGTRIQSLALVGENGETEVLVEDGELVVDADLPIRMVTLDFLFGIFSSSNFIGGDGYPFPAFAQEGSVVQLKNELTEEGDATFSQPGGEQDALAEYLLANFSGDSVFDAAETAIADDLRIQNLSERGDIVSDITHYGTDIADTLVGDEESDLIYANGGNDIAAGGLGDDAIFGGDGDDILRGDRNSRRTQDKEAGGDDIIFGGAGNDRIGGKAGNDTLYGDEGDDTIWGDDGDDLIFGGLGNDTLIGDNFSRGAGTDTFVVAEGEGTDTILDFEVGIDFIGLAGGLTQAQLSFEGNAIKLGNETLAILEGVADASVVDFTIV